MFRPASGNDEGIALSQQDQTTVPPQAQTAAAPSQTAAAVASARAAAHQPSSQVRKAWGRLALPLFAVLAAFVFIALATLRWDAWVGSAAIQTTNDAYVRAELTRLSSRVAGEVLVVAVNDFQRVRAGDLLVQIDPADYQAQVEHVASLPAALGPQVGPIVIEDAELAKRVDRQRRQLVIQLAPLQLDHQAREAGALARRRRGQQAQPVELHRQDARLQLHQPVAEDRVVDHPLAIHRLGFHQLDQRSQPGLRGVGIAQHAALVLQRRIGHEPAPPASADDQFSNSVQEVHS